MLPGTTLVLRHKATGGNVFIVGCVHGSEASEEDVTMVIEGQAPAAVVLELCESRYTSMQQEEINQAVLQAQQEEARRASKAGRSSAPPPSPNKALAHLAKLGARLHAFSLEFGLTQTVLVALLSSSAEVQRVLTSGKGARGRAACEFRTSMELAEARNLAVILGDQDLSVTLGRFKKGLHPWWGNKEEGEEEEAQGPFRAVTELASIRDALLGPADLPSSQRVEVLPLLFTQVRYLKEIIKVLVPVGVVVMVALRVVESMGDMALDSLNHLLPASTLLTSLLTATASSSQPVGEVVAASSSVLDGELVSNVGWGLLNLGMLLYFMSINRYILVERDAFLADSIAQAVAQYKGKNVAAVVGLLHGNGVARHLRTRHGFELVDRP